LINDVVRISGKRITFTCTLEGRPDAYDFSAPDAEIASHLVEILRKNKGMTLFSIGTLEIPSNQ